MRFRAIVQARLKSSRLPRKVLEKIGSLTLLEHIAARLATLEGAGVESVFAIAEGEGADLADFLREKGLKYHAGADFDVLSRYLAAADGLADSDYVIRLTGDNPFPDKNQLAMLLQYIRQHPLDYAYTADLPLGMGSEVIRVNALRSILLRAQPLSKDTESEIKQHHREHVTVFIRENPHLYDILPFRLDTTISEEAARERVHGIRLTVDEPEDLAVCREVFTHFNRLGNAHFGALDVIQLAKNNPEMFAGNAQIRQKSAQSVDERAPK